MGPRWMGHSDWGVALAGEGGGMPRVWRIWARVSVMEAMRWRWMSRFRSSWVRAREVLVRGERGVAVLGWRLGMVGVAWVGVAWVDVAWVGVARVGFAWAMLLCWIFCLVV
ncbi:hypothetical protein Tdes44962_MAKER04394 [Teratosphaeria destructans]|uniref:Uncharacterized protein n=1 Tax=Teratosphaeria destructans TaxID=418781 RepID=A0A9W7SMG6_9PEZI|nr:hypothetical protein Tdes44962_MAKER04394 [Teratosphaeria destructans]